MFRTAGSYSTGLIPTIFAAMAFLLIEGCTTADQMQSLVNKGQYDQAYQLYLSKRGEMAAGGAKTSRALQAMAAHFNARLLPPVIESKKQLDAKIKAFAEDAKLTDQLQTAIRNAKSNLATYNANEILSNPAYRSPEVGKLEAAIRRAQGGLANFGEAKEFNEKFRPGLVRSLDHLKRTAGKWPLPSSAWSAARKAVQSAHASLETYRTNAPDSMGGYTAPEVDSLEAELAKFEGRLANDAIGRFRGFDHFSGRSFFDAYPARLDANQFFAAHPTAIVDTLAGATSVQLTSFAKTYGAAAPEVKKTVGDLYGSALLHEELAGRERTLKDVINAYWSARRDGFAPESLVGYTVFVGHAADSLSGGAAHSFAIGEWPFDYGLGAVDELPLGDQAMVADYLILINSPLIHATRQAKGVRTVRGKYKSSERAVPNPEYRKVQTTVSAKDRALRSLERSLGSAERQLDRAQIAVDRADAELRRVRSRFNAAGGTDSKELIRKDLELAEIESYTAAKSLRRAQQDLTETENDLDDALTDLADAEAERASVVETLYEPVYSKYAYKLHTFEVTREITTAYYIVDHTTSKFVRLAYIHTESENFDLPRGIRQNDPDNEQLLEDYASEAKITDYEAQRPALDLDSLIAHYLGQPTRTQPLVADNLIEIMFQDQDSAYEKSSLSGDDFPPGEISLLQ